jgi:hypothetical protein
MRIVPVGALFGLSNMPGASASNAGLLEEMDFGFPAALFMPFLARFGAVTVDFIYAEGSSSHEYLAV